MFDVHHNFYFNLKNNHVVSPNSNGKDFFKSNDLYLGNNDFSSVFVGNVDFSSTGGQVRFYKDLHQNVLRDMNLGKRNFVKNDFVNEYKTIVKSDLIRMNTHSNSMKKIDKDSYEVLLRRIDFK